MNNQPSSPLKTSRRNLLRYSLNLGILAALFGSKANVVAAAAATEPAPEPATVHDWSAELAKRIAALEARGGGTLELGDGVYEISQPLRLPRSVSLVMTPNAVIRAKANFQGEAVVIKGGGDYSKPAHTAGWIRGGVIDGNRQPLTGIRVEDLHRLEIADLSVLNCLLKGIHLLKGGNESNLTRVRCDVDMDTHYTPESIGIHIQRTDCKVNLAHVIGYETGVRSDAGSNWFSQVHVWNWQPTQGPMKYCFHCNGGSNSFSQCYADSPTVAGFYITAAYQSVMQSRVYFSRWADDNTGAGFLITAKGRHGAYLGNAIFADKDHKLAKAFDGDLEGACILGNSFRNVVGGMENRIASGNSLEHPPVNFSGSGLRLERQTSSPQPADGQLGEVRWVDDGTASSLWIKTTTGWKKSQLG